MGTATTISPLDLGCYEAERAASLSGVPLSTVYHWAREGPVRPSISDTREKLWSYRDLLTLRLVRWLRTTKEDLGVEATAMAEVRKTLDKLGQDLWRTTSEGADLPTIVVARDGTVFQDERPLVVPAWQATLDDEWTSSRRSRPGLTCAPRASDCASCQARSQASHTSRARD